MPEDEPLALSVTHADGRITRWGPDEPAGKDIPNDLTFSDSIPGGDATLSTSLLRRIDVQHHDEALFDAVRAYDAGGRTAWSGYMAQFPRTHGDQFGVSPGAVGWSAVLRWDTGFREIYVDRDLTGWGEPSVQRRITVAGLAASLHAASTSPDDTTGSSTLAAEFQGPWNATGTPLVEATYSSGGIPIGFVYYEWAKGGNIGLPDVNWTWKVHLSSDSTFAGVDSTAELQGAGPGTGATLSATFADRAYAMAQFGYKTAAGGDTRTYGLYWKQLAVYGNHGVARVGTEPGGFYASDVIADVVSRAAPQLNYTTGAGGSIEPTSFVIPHLVYRDPVTAEFAISDVNKYHLYDWGVEGDREFFFRQPDPNRLLWEARLSDGAHLDADGDTAEQVINGVVVTYSDPTGITKTVGPPGGVFDNTDTALADTSSSNPVNAHGLGRKWVQLALSFPTTLAGATAIGAAYLAERSLAGRRGTVTLTGTATHPTEGKVPCWRVRSGDWITLKDLNGAVVPRKIISKTYTHSSRSVSLQLDNSVAKLDAIMARVGVLAGIQTGGGF